MRQNFEVRVNLSCGVSNQTGHPVLEYQIRNDTRFAKLKGRTFPCSRYLLPKTIEFSVRSFEPCRQDH